MLDGIDDYELFYMSDLVMTLERFGETHDAKHNVITDFIKDNYRKGDVSGVLKKTHTVISRIDANGIWPSMQVGVIKKIKAADEGVYEVRIKAKPPLRFLCFIPKENNNLAIVLGFLGHKNKRPDELVKMNKDKIEIARTLLIEKMRSE